MERGSDSGLGPDDGVSLVCAADEVPPREAADPYLVASLSNGATPSTGSEAFVSGTKLTGASCLGVGY